MCLIFLSFFQKNHLNTETKRSCAILHNFNSWMTKYKKNMAIWYNSYFGLILSCKIAKFFWGSQFLSWEDFLREYSGLQYSGSQKLPTIRIVCQYPYLRLEPAFYTWYCTKIVKFSLISLCFCQQTLRECEFPEVYDYQDSSNNKMWVFKKCIGYFLSIIFITLSVT